MAKCVFLDRDGVINPLIHRIDGRITSPWNIDEFSFISGVEEACKKLKDEGFLLFCITNQPHVYSNDMTYDEIKEIMFHITSSLGLDDYVAIFDKKTYDYKPGNYWFEHLIEKYKIDRSESWSIGDRWKDIVPSHKSRLNTIFIGEEYTYPFEYKDIVPDYQTNSLLEAAHIIIEVN